MKYGSLTSSDVSGSSWFGVVDGWGVLDRERSGMGGKGLDELVLASRVDSMGGCCDAGSSGEGDC